MKTAPRPIRPRRRRTKAMSRSFAAMVAVAFFPPLAFAQLPADLNTAEQLSQALKPILIDKMPPVLYQNSENWGHQAMVPVGLKWYRGRAEVQKSLRNHGEGKRLAVGARDLKRTLALKIHNVKTIDAEKQAFKVFLTFQLGAHYEQQNWANGVKLWAGHLVARAQVKLDLDCENTMRVDFDKGPLPDFVVRIRVTNAKVSYDNLVVEHI